MSQYRNTLFPPAGALVSRDDEDDSPALAEDAARAASETRGDLPEDAPAMKYSRRHSAADEAALKACRGYMRKAMKALDDAGAPDEDGDGVPDAMEAKAVDYDSHAEMVRDAILEAIDLDDDVPAAALPYRVSPDDDDEDDEPNILVYGDYAILMVGPESYRVPYAIEAGDVALSPPAEWERVEAEWVPVQGAPSYTESHGDSPAPAPAVKLAGDLVVGPAVRFGAPDEPDISPMRDFFTKSTDFWLDKWDRRPMIYDHAQVDDELIRQLRKQGADRATIKAMEEALDYLKWNPVVGLWTKATVDPMALWLQGEIDKAHRYKAYVKELVRRGLLKLSTDSAPHLVIREPQPNGANEIKRWPIYAASLTPHAAEPRLWDVQSLKGFYDAAGLALPAELISTKAQPEGLTAEAARLLVDAYTTAGGYMLRRRYSH